MVQGASITVVPRYPYMLFHCFARIYLQFLVKFSFMKQSYLRARHPDAKEIYLMNFQLLNHCLLFIEMQPNYLTFMHINKLVEASNKSLFYFVYVYVKPHWHVGKSV